MLNSPEEPGSAAPGEGPQQPQPGLGGLGGEQPRPMTINVTAQEKEAIDRVCECLVLLVLVALWEFS